MVEVIRELVVFSLEYAQRKKRREKIFSADWNWPYQEKWSKSRLRRVAGKEDWDWRHEQGGINEMSRQAILRYFGLLDWRKEFPIEKIKKMSPAKLAGERRKKEAEFGLPRLPLLSGRCLVADDGGIVILTAEDYF